LPREDPDLAAVIAESLIADGVELHLSAHTDKVAADGGRIKLALSRPGEKTSELSADQLLVATGRKPVLSGLNLNSAGVLTDANGLILDRPLRTTNRQIFACGDVAGPWLFTHMAEHQAGIVLRNTLFRLPAKFNPTTVPWCTFTDPELARVGLSEPKHWSARSNTRFTGSRSASSIAALPIVRPGVW
jgi:pyruvate/2-oxoglutarate dehydrogenase complex dihydrolipoamide dehydrogenase (E3) component